jgi:FtsZ-binding cell division protein ZapB
MLLFPKLAELRLQIQGHLEEMAEASRAEQEAELEAIATNQLLTEELKEARASLAQARAKRWAADAAFEEERKASIASLRTMEGEEFLKNVAKELDLLDSVERALVHSRQYAQFLPFEEVIKCADIIAKLDITADKVREHRDLLEKEVEDARNKAHAQNMRRTPELDKAWKALDEARDTEHSASTVSFEEATRLAKGVVVDYRINARKLPLKAIWAAMYLLDEGHL